MTTRQYHERVLVENYRNYVGLDAEYRAKMTAAALELQTMFQGALHADAEPAFTWDDIARLLNTSKSSLWRQFGPKPDRGWLAKP